MLFRNSLVLLDGHGLQTQDVLPGLPLPPAFADRSAAQGARSCLQVPITLMPGPRLLSLQQLKVQIETPPVLLTQTVDDEGLSDSERRLAKGMSRRTMCGPPLLDHIKDKVDVAALKVGGGILGHGVTGRGGKWRGCAWVHQGCGRAHVEWWGMGGVPGHGV